MIPILSSCDQLSVWHKNVHCFGKSTYNRLLFTTQPFLKCKFKRNRTFSAINKHVNFVLQKLSKPPYPTYDLVSITNETINYCNDLFQKSWFKTYQQQNHQKQPTYPQRIAACRTVLSKLSCMIELSSDFNRDSMMELKNILYNPDNHFYLDEYKQYFDNVWRLSVEQWQKAEHAHLGFKVEKNILTQCTKMSDIGVLAAMDVDLMSDIVKMTQLKMSCEDVNAECLRILLQEWNNLNDGNDIELMIKTLANACLTKIDIEWLRVDIQQKLVKLEEKPLLNLFELVMKQSIGLIEIFCNTIESKYAIAKSVTGLIFETFTNIIYTHRLSQCVPCLNQCLKILFYNLDIDSQFSNPNWKKVIKIVKEFEFFRANTRSAICQHKRMGDIITKMHQFLVQDRQLITLMYSHIMAEFVAEMIGRITCVNGFVPNELVSLIDCDEFHSIRRDYTRFIRDVYMNRNNLHEVERTYEYDPQFKNWMDSYKSHYTKWYYYSLGSDVLYGSVHKIYGFPNGWINNLNFDFQTCIASIYQYSYMSRKGGFPCWSVYYNLTQMYKLCCNKKLEWSRILYLLQTRRRSNLLTTSNGVIGNSKQQQQCYKYDLHVQYKSDHFAIIQCSKRAIESKKDVLSKNQDIQDVFVRDAVDYDESKECQTPIFRSSVYTTLFGCKGLANGVAVYYDKFKRQHDINYTHRMFIRDSTCPWVIICVEKDLIFENVIVLDYFGNPVCIDQIVLKAFKLNNAWQKFIANTANDGTIHLTDDMTQQIPDLSWASNFSKSVHHMTGVPESSISSKSFYLGKLEITHNSMQYSPKSLSNWNNDKDFAENNKGNVIFTVTYKNNLARSQFIGTIVDKLCTDPDKPTTFRVTQYCECFLDLKHHKYPLLIFRKPTKKEKGGGSS